MDDHPEFNNWEKRALRSLGARVTTALSNAEAVDLLRRDDYDLIISDIGRDNGEEVRQLWQSVSARPGAAPIIYYVADLKPGHPEEAVGITNRPDALLDLITDALQRRQFRLRGDS